MQRREFIAMTASAPSPSVPSDADAQAPTPAAVRKPLSITLLGTGTPSPSLDRQSSGYLIEVGHDVIVCDHGCGAHHRLLQAGHRSVRRPLTALMIDLLPRPATRLATLASVAHSSAGRTRRHLSALVAVVATVAGLSCSTHSPATSTPNLFDAQRRVEDYINSGRYEQDMAAVAAQAKKWLEQRAPAVSKPAIVLDIDETSLSNWPAYRINGWGRVVSGGCDLQSGPCGLRAWQAMAESKAIPATLELARRAKDMGVAVFFISGRPPNLRDATERNLREQGYAWDGVVLLPEGAQFASAADFKAPERRKITERGYTIVLTMGDQQSDLSGGFAEKTFKLPNPVYFLP